MIWKSKQTQQDRLCLSWGIRHWGALLLGVRLLERKSNLYNKVLEKV